MPTVKGGGGRSNGQRPGSNYHDSAQIKKTSAPSIARDDLDGAYAGDENGGTISQSEHSTNVKARKVQNDTGDGDSGQNRKGRRKESDV